MRPDFVEQTLTKLVASGDMGRGDRILTVCSDTAERDLFQELGFTNVTISNVDPALSAENCAPYAASFQNAMELTFPDDEFDFAFVSDGLHHCSSPHRALLEMYRVARKGVIVIESRDSLLLRLAVILRLTGDYELDAVTYNEGRLGGVDNSEIPNHVYRWTEREFVKTIRSYHPVGKHRFRFNYGLGTPSITAQKGPLATLMRLATRGLAIIFPLIAKRQCNSFAMIALRPTLPDNLWAWLKLQNGAVHFHDNVGTAQDLEPPITQQKLQLQGKQAKADGGHE